MANKLSSYFLVTCFFLLIMIPLFLQLGLASRILADDVSQNKDNGQGKTGLRGSQPGHDGSNTGDGPPSGAVLMSPPTTATKIAYATVTVNGTAPGAPKKNP